VATWRGRGVHLHDAILQYRGMSLHRWLRLRRLWLVRQRLLAGTQRQGRRVAFGLASQRFRTTTPAIGESPSVTLARAAGIERDGADRPLNPQ
jgi:AraC family ethanolamine operon transcriptional activator